MNRIIINTANSELFIVLQKDNEIFSSKLSSQMKHNETMLPEIDKLLKSVNVQLKDIEEYGVVVGPGSFTGIRVGIATIKAFRDVFGVKAKGINNLDYLFSLAREVDEKVKVVAIAGSKNNYFVAREIHGVVYKYERTLSLDELKEISNGQKIGMFEEDENLNCFVVGQGEKSIIECLEKSNDEKLIPIYYQLSQAENEKIKRLSVEILPANIEDAEKIYKIEKESILVNALSLENIKSSIDDKNYLVFKAVADEEIVGFIILQKSDELNIDSIAVKKEFRNFGIATKLIGKAEEIAKTNQISTLSLEVSFKNVNAFLLYEKLGFKQRRVRKSYYSDGTDCVEMIKTV